MDSDTTSRVNAHSDILGRVGAGEVDILVGTQMIAKGHDFQKITLVGVVLADIGMGLPDFRATEKAFQFLMQVSGRSGRGKTAGRVIIQTLNPTHYAIEEAMGHNYHAFYQREIGIRKQHGFPPFSRIVSVLFYTPRREDGERAIQGIKKSFATCLRGIDGVDLLGPVPAPIFKARGNYRWQVIIKGQSVDAIGRCARRLLQVAERQKINAIADVDPLGFM